MIKKFGKNRSVDSKWLNVPIKYMSEVTGSNTGSNGKYVSLSLKEQYENYVKWHNDNNWFNSTPMSIEEYKDYLKKFPDANESEWVPAKHDKTFCIIELSKNWATCGWRNNETYSIGMPIKCRVVKKGKKVGIIYKDKFYLINTSSSGWVF